MTVKSQNTSNKTKNKLIVSNLEFHSSRLERKVAHSSEKSNKFYIYRLILKHQASMNMLVDIGGNV